MPVKTIPLPSLTFLNEILYLDDSSPTGLRWRKTRGGKAQAGSIAGTKHNQGYWSISITTDKQRMYLCHRIIYYMRTGEDLNGKYIDHVNGERSNNKELRSCQHKENIYNQRKMPGNKYRKYTSKFKSVSWDSFKKKWKAQISINGCNKNLGRYPTELAAAQIYNQAALEHYGDFACINDLSEYGCDSCGLAGKLLAEAGVKYDAIDDG